MLAPFDSPCFPSVQILEVAADVASGTTLTPAESKLVSHYGVVARSWADFLPIAQQLNQPAVRPRHIAMLMDWVQVCGHVCRRTCLSLRTAPLTAWVLVLAQMRCCLCWWPGSQTRHGEWCWQLVVLFLSERDSPRPHNTHTHTHSFTEGKSLAFVVPPPSFPSCYYLFRSSAE